MTIQLRGEPSHHGTRKCYEFYGCRCAPCWAAGVTARAKKREYMRDYMAEYRRLNRDKLRERNRDWMRRYRAAMRASTGGVAA
jgi:hypothetical protein